MPLDEFGDSATVWRAATHDSPDASLPPTRSLAQRLLGESPKVAAPSGTAPCRLGIDRGEHLVGKGNHDLGHHSSIAVCPPWILPCTR